MMWLLLVIPFAIAAGSEILDEDCRPVYIACEAENLPDTPKTLEEFEYACDSVTKFIECGISVEERCEFDPRALKVATAVLPTVNEVCDKDTELHKVVVNNLQCLHEFFDTGSGLHCFFSVSDDNEKIKESIDAMVEQNLGDSDNEHQLRECLLGIYRIACFALELKQECGEDAMGGLVQILRQVSRETFEICGEEVHELLPTVIEVYKDL